ncbi:DUF4442 domain-containing protein [Flagellimonas sp. DF-77]|uniref:DUF4442 domain-containing protein n=1 Tax=Flagellimonas algarum TaxID=3230298 RepID=UPI00339285E8
MSFYQRFTEIGSKFIGKATLFKHGFNWSPMYRRSTAKIRAVSKDLKQIDIKLPISYKNRNYVNSIFGGSMFSAVDPIPMVQLMNLLGKDYVVWDKSAQIFFKRPAKTDLYARFTVTEEELDVIKQRVAKEKEIDIVKITRLQDRSFETVFCEVHKTIYIADKAFFKAKRKKKRENANKATQ